MVIDVHSNMCVVNLIVRAAEVTMAWVATATMVAEVSALMGEVSTTVETVASMEVFDPFQNCF